MSVISKSNHNNEHYLLLQNSLSHFFIAMPRSVLAMSGGGETRLLDSDGTRPFGGRAGAAGR
jgi:hypothetical protein